MESRFNPTLVRLRLLKTRKATRHPFLFQSHAGSIEAQHERERTRRQPRFQSHAGSIEAIKGTVKGVGQYSRFNPTLVRLRPGD